MIGGTRQCPIPGYIYYISLLLPREVVLQRLNNNGRAPIFNSFMAEEDNSCQSSNNKSNVKSVQYLEMNYSKNNQQLFH